MRFIMCCFLIFLGLVAGLPQVPYDYIPIGRKSQPRPENHPSDVVLNYEKLYPSRRKFID